MQSLRRNTFSQLGCGIQLRGQKSTYSICGQFRANNQDVWPAFDLNRKPVVIKRAPFNQFRNEIRALRLCNGSPYIRQLVDTSDSPPSMILERLDTTLYAASCQQKLERLEIKRAVKATLKGLALLHSHGITHNDVKPDNILANRGSGSRRFTEIKLADFGESSLDTDSAWHKWPLSGTIVYRAPEIILRALSTSAADVWALGATALFFLVGDHFFAPRSTGLEDELVHDFILRRQMSCFGPFPDRFIDIVPDIYKEYYLELEGETRYYPDRWPGPLTSFLSPEEEEFIRLLLMADPRDRPSAIEAVHHPWLRDVE